MKKLVTDKTINWIIGSVLAILLLVMTFLANKEETPAEGWYLPLSIIVSLLAGVLCIIKLDFKVWRVLRNLISILVIPFTAVLFVQYYFIDPWGAKPIYPMMLLANMAFYYLIYLLLAFVFGRWNIGYTVATVIFMLIGITNYYIMQFRGSPIVPWDIYSIGTGASVMNNYSYMPNWRFVFATFAFAGMLIFGMKNKWKIRPIPVRIIGALLMAGCFVFCTSKLQEKEVKDWLGMDQTLFTPTVRYRNNGLVAAFLGNLHLIEVEKPEGYSTQKVKEIQEEIQSEDSYKENQQVNASFDSTKAPNIIVVLDEAFSDLTVRGDFGMSEDPIPYFHKMMEESDSGHLLVSVKGGNTANTEYEFFTGDTMAFLPAGAVVYQQYMHDNVPALPDYLSSLGYATTGIHPYLTTGWNRNTVYPQLGFEKFLSQTDFYNPKMVRNYISDESAFDKIVDTYKANKEKNSDQPQFIFEITMQNHSGYSPDFPGFGPEIDLTDLSYSNTQTTATEKYLTLIHYSDQALEKMMEYFKSIDEPTIVVMFGDHQPSDYVTDVIDRITGYNPQSDDIEESQKSYLVPYFVWNNFGMKMDENNTELMSVNYLAANILDAAGMPLTQYQEFLLEMQKTLKAVAGNAYVDANGTYHAYDEENEYTSLLNNYNILQYNHLNDRSNRLTSVFDRIDTNVGKLAETNAPADNKATEIETED